jgi:ubiquinone/menaquinone biosynthesis C-methylase UbiE
MHANNSTNRFSDRADNYNLYRPVYPAAIISWLEEKIGLNKDSRIADIGSGTGIFSTLFLASGYSLNAVEPNTEMRSVALKNLQHYHGFRNIDGTAEHTTLTDNSVDLITVAQAFHWFNEEAVKKEFKRILIPGGTILLVWNILQADTPFLKGYAALKEKYAENLPHPGRANLESIQGFFYPSAVTTHQIRNIQWLTAEGLKGYLLSFSTVPLKTEILYNNMIDELKNLFEQYAENGLIKMEYETMLYLSKIAD